MSITGTDLAPSQSAVLELEQERLLVREGYDFLDEKRLLLAAGLLRELTRYESLMTAFTERHKEASGAIARAAMRHGLHGVQVYPAPRLEDAELRLAERIYLGVRLVEGELVASEPAERPRAEWPSPEAERCRALLSEMLRDAAVIAAVAGNLFRLVDEYRRTERRARALENVLLPEIEEVLRDMRAHLEDADLEEIIRTRLQYGD